MQIPYNDLNDIVVQHLYQSYQNLYWNAVLSMRAYEEDNSKTYHLDETIQNNDTMAAIEKVLDYYATFRDYEDKLQSLKKEVDEEFANEDASARIKRMGDK